MLFSIETFSAKLANVWYRQWLNLLLREGKKHFRYSNFAGTFIMRSTHGLLFAFAFHFAKFTFAAAFLPFVHLPQMDTQSNHLMKMISANVALEVLLAIALMDWHVPSQRRIGWIQFAALWTWQATFCVTEKTKRNRVIRRKKQLMRNQPVVTEYVHEVVSPKWFSGSIWFKALKTDESILIVNQEIISFLARGLAFCISICLSSLSIGSWLCFGWLNFRCFQYWQFIHHYWMEIHRFYIFFRCPLAVIILEPSRIVFL